MMDKEIIKILNTATNIDGLQICCIDYENDPETKTFLSIKSDIVDLINRQQAEIKDLKSELKITREYLHNNGLEWDLLSYATRKEMVGEDK